MRPRKLEWLFKNYDDKGIDKGSDDKSIHNGSEQTKQTDSIWR